MSIQLNHTIVHSRDKVTAATFLTELFGLPPPVKFSHFLVVQTANGVSLDYMEHGEGEISAQHYAFLVSEQEFDAIFARIKERGLDYWADPGGKRLKEINRNDGGRGLYFQDPSGHWMEIITRPYGG